MQKVHHVWMWCTHHSKTIWSGEMLTVLSRLLLQWIFLSLLFFQVSHFACHISFNVFPLFFLTNPRTSVITVWLLKLQLTHKHSKTCIAHCTVKVLMFCSFISGFAVCGGFYAHLFSIQHRNSFLAVKYKQNSDKYDPI